MLNNLLQTLLDNGFTLLLQLLPGALLALKLFIFTIIFSIPLGIMLAIGRLAKFEPLAKTVQFYIWIIRGTPLMLQLIFAYFGIASFGLGLDRFYAALITFVLNYSAYFAEIFRGGIQAIDRSQYEGAEVLGLRKWQIMYRIILPQTIKIVLPALSNEFISLIKDTSLAQVIGIVEIFTLVKITASRDFVIYPFIVAAAFYLIMTLLITKIFEIMEKYYTYYE